MNDNKCLEIEKKYIGVTHLPKNSKIRRFHGLSSAMTDEHSSCFISLIVTFTLNQFVGLIPNSTQTTNS